MNEKTINVGNVHKYTITNLNPNTLYGFKVQAVYKDGTISSYSNTLLSETKSIIIMYSVTYNGNGSTDGTAPVDSLSPYVKGSSVIVLRKGSLVKTGYTFTNWNTIANGTGTSYLPNSQFIITANTILYAQWTLSPTPTPTNII